MRRVTDAVIMALFLAFTAMAAGPEVVLHVKVMTIDSSHFVWHEWTGDMKTVFPVWPEFRDYVAELNEMPPGDEAFTKLQAGTRLDLPTLQVKTVASGVFGGTELSAHEPPGRRISATTVVAIFLDGTYEDGGDDRRETYFCPGGMTTSECADEARANEANDAARRNIHARSRTGPPGTLSEPSPGG